MANELQNSIFTAVDTIIEKRVEELELDKTVIASIEQLVDATTGKYRVQYKGGSMFAYASADQAYAANTSVYVSVPQNDYTKKKWIIGKVSETAGDQAITEVSTAIEDYQIVGNNVVSVKDGFEQEFGLFSYKGSDEKVLYARGQEDVNVLAIDEDKLKQYLDKSIALLIEATFRTDLDSTQRNQASAEYGLVFDLIFEDGDATYSTLGDKFDALAPQIKLKTSDGSNFYSLLDCDNEVKDIAKNQADVEFNLNLQRANVAAFIDRFSSEENELTQLYLSLLDEMISLFDSGKDWITPYEEWFSASADTFVTKRVVYQLDTSDMIGNPFLFRIAAEQYNIYPIDTGRFQYIESITFYSTGFKAEPSYEDFGADIFVRDIEFYGLEELAAVNGDYSLRLKFPQGQIFDLPTEDEEGNLIQPSNLKIKGQLNYQDVELATGVSWYWFIKDGQISSAEHPDYHYLGGVGWRYFDNVVNKELTVSAEANTAYENIYKCIAVYNSTMILKSEFTIYNDANRRDIIIESNLGKTFQFDRGTPVLTCKIRDSYMEEEEPIEVPDSYSHKGRTYDYEYLWLRKDQQNQIVVFDKTYDELLEEYQKTSFSAKIELKTKMAEMQGIEFDKNKMTYPASKIATNTAMTFECYVYRTERGKDGSGVYLGCGSIILKNEDAAKLNEYYIVIENGDQVFQYSESGVSPCNERYSDPVVPKNLICHLYDPNGLEVNSNGYAVKWQYPLTSTLLVPPDDLKVNPSVGLEQWLYEEQAPIAIEESYDWSALDNQILCIVEYGTIKVSKETEFYFGKIGDNGTNGTDVVAKIQPWGVNGNMLDNEPLTLIKHSKGISEWNSGQPFGESGTPLELRLYRRNEYIAPVNYKGGKWTMAGGSTKSEWFIATAQDNDNRHLAKIIENTSSSTSRLNNLIVKAEAELPKEDGSSENQTHYAFYPISVIDYGNNPKRDISIDKDRTLKHVLYNADGRNPVYNQNQGIFFNFSLDEESSYSVSWTAKGGLSTNENTPAFDLFTGENPDNLTNKIEDTPYVYIKPKDVYTGAAQNNHVQAVIKENEKIVATAYIPIYMSLNLYGLASLNAWDGNTIEINEDHNYIMAPQIGAGIKNSENAFTGIVMGTATDYNGGEDSVGLLGYSEGRQSIFLDAQTGNATFGLPEVDERDNEKGQDYSQGRIELRPGGLSSISNWKINSRSLFNVPDADKSSDSYSAWGGLSEPYDDLGKEYIKSIPHDKSGILLSSEPSYISIKGRQLTLEDEIDYTQANTIVKPTDTFELQLNPNDGSIFTIYRHTTAAKNVNMGVREEGNETFVGLINSGEEGDSQFSPEELAKQYSVPIRNDEGEIIGWNALEKDSGEYFFPYPFYDKRGKFQCWLIKGVDKPGEYYYDRDKDSGIWRREPRVGINNQGRFYTNALKSSSSALTIDAIGAFGQTADSGQYVGASFDVGSSDDKSISLIKMFTRTGGVDNRALDDPTGILHISGSSDVENEYIRPMRLYGNSITLLSQDDERKNNAKIYSKNRLSLKQDSLFFGTAEAYAGSDRMIVEDKPEETGDYLHFREDSTNLYTRKPLSMIIGTEQMELPWLLTSYPLGSKQNSTANATTKVSSGSIGNYAYGKNSEQGHIKNYANRSLQLNQAYQAKKTDENGKEVYEFLIDKALQINENNIVLGSIDKLQVTNEDRENWDRGGVVPLISGITQGRTLKMDKYGSTLYSDVPIGLYTNAGIEIRSLKKGNTGSPINIQTTGSSGTPVRLTFLPNATDGTNSFYLSSLHGTVAANDKVRDTYVAEQNSKIGVWINPGFKANFGIFAGNIGTGSNSSRSIYAHQNIYTENYLEGKDLLFRDFNIDGSWNAWRAGGGSYNKYGVASIITYLWDEIKSVKNSIPSLDGYVTKSWANQNLVYLSTYNSHKHGVGNNGSFMVKAAGIVPSVENGVLTNYGSQAYTNTP